MPLFKLTITNTDARNFLKTEIRVFGNVFMCVCVFSLPQTEAQYGPDSGWGWAQPTRHWARARPCGPGERALVLRAHHFQNQWSLVSEHRYAQLTQTSTHSSILFCFFETESQAQQSKQWCQLTFIFPSWCFGFYTKSLPRSRGSNPTLIHACAAQLCSLLPKQVWKGRVSQGVMWFLGGSGNERGGLFTGAFILLKLLMRHLALYTWLTCGWNVNKWVIWFIFTSSHHELNLYRAFPASS